MAYDSAEDDRLDRSEKLYARRAAMDEIQPIQGEIVSVHELIDFVCGRTPGLGKEKIAQLFTDARLQADYQRLKSALSMAAIPRQAAASDAPLVERKIEGGTIRIQSSRIPGQIYVIIAFDRPDRRASSLLIETDGEVSSRALPSPDHLGQILLVCDISSEADAQLVRMLGDPGATGAFLV